MSKLEETIIVAQSTKLGRPVDIINFTGNKWSITGNETTKTISVTSTRHQKLFTYPFTAGVSTGQVIYFPFFNEQGSTTTAPTESTFTKRQWLGAGTLLNLYLAVRKDSGATALATCTIYKNGVPTGLTVGVSVTSPNWATGIDATNQVTLVDSDWITIMLTSATQGINQATVRCDFRTA